MKFKKLKKALALALALTVAGTTNLGGLENVVKVEAAGRTESTICTINGVDWKYTIDADDGIVRAVLCNPLTVKGKDVTVPTTIAGKTVEEYSASKDAEFRSLTVPSGVTLSGSLTCDTLYCKTEQIKLYYSSSTVKNIEFDGSGQDYTIPSSAFYKFTTLENVTFKDIETLTINHYAFSKCTSLKELNIDSDIGNIVFGRYSFAQCTNLAEIHVGASSTLYQCSFSNCIGLKHVTFDNYVYMHPVQHYVITSGLYECGLGAFINDGGIFHNSFGELEYDENGNVEKKSITFNGEVTCIYANNQLSGDSFADTSVIDDCSGLTDVIFNGNVSIQTDNFFSDCENLSNIEFNSYTTLLANEEFVNLPSLKFLEIKGTIDAGTSAGNTNHLGTYNHPSPFKNSNIETLVINDALTIDITDVPNLKTLYFKGHVGSSSTKNMLLNNCDNLDSIIFNPDMTNFNSYSELDLMYNNINLIDTCDRKHYVYGFKYANAKNNYVASWAGSDNAPHAEYTNIISSVSTYYDVDDDTATKIIGNNLTKDDIDKSKIVVTAKLADSVAEFLQQIKHPVENFENFDEKKSIIVEPIKNFENTGYELSLPEKLYENSRNIYTVTYSNVSADGTIKVENQKTASLNVNWNNTAISNLVANQPVTLASVASGATITYNDNTTQPVSNSALVLDKTTTTLGDNIFTISLKENETIKDSKTFTIKENYITAIKAEYNSNATLYVGDKIDASKVKLTPTYKYDEDKTVNRDILFTKLSQSQLTKEGANEITVYYNDLETTMVVSAAAVVPTKIYAMFDTNCKYYEGQENIDPQTVLVTVEYNNGTKKSGADLAYAYEVTKIQDGATIIQAKVSYAELESVIEIPVTPKEITGIKASANIASATEGTTLPKTMIDKIEITYNNGKTETLDASTIDYNNLTFNNYTIIANTPNTITINYAGKTAEITIWGVSNSVTRIYAEYIGSGQIVGTQIPTSDIAVHAVNANGQITTITDGILLENAVPYNVGPNTVTVHYGSFSCTIIVTGLLIPVATVAPSLTPGATGTSATQEPTKTNQPTATSSVTETPGTATTVVSTPNTANSAPIVVNSSVTITSNNKKITAATDETYKVYTNKNVVLTIASVSASAIKYQVVTKGVKVSDTAWKDVANNKITVSKTKKASIVYIQYPDANGAVQTIHTNGFTIDKKKATVNVKKNKTYKSGKKVTFKDASGIKSAKLDGKKVKSGVKVKKKGTHTLAVTDKAGNKTTIKFKVK